MSTTDVATTRRSLLPALFAFAEQYIAINGVNGYADATYGAFAKAGIGNSAGSLRDWFQEQPGWKKRRDAAEAAYAKRVDGVDPNHPTVRKLERELRVSQADLARVEAQLAAADANTSAFEKAAAILDAVVQPLDLVPLAPRKHDATAHPVDLVTLLTDQHADEVIHGPQTWGLERYNFDVFCLRLERWTRMVTEYATGLHLPRHRVERLHIFHLGDSIHGDGHGNKHRNHFDNSMKAAIAVADAQSEALAHILERVPYVSMVCVSGNHPRTSVKKDHVDPHDNFDFMVAAIMAARLRAYIDAGRLDIHAPKSWTAFVDVRGKVFALNHGDDVVGTWGIPWYGFSRKQSRVQAMVGRKDVNVDFFCFGHFHTDMAVTENGARAIHGGAFTSTDAWTIEKVASGGEPMQPMVVIDDQPGMRSRLLDIPIWLRDDKLESLFWAGKHKPALGRTNTLTQLTGADTAAKGGALPLITARK